MSPLILAFALALVVALLARPAHADADEPPEATAAKADPYATVKAEMQALGGPRFTVVVEPPYVIAGDGDPATVRRRAASTVRWSHDKLRRQFFAKDPDDPVRVWLFKDERSYVAHVQAWLGETPDTPYGFAGETGLYMNISTGGGTLVHEMVHPLVDANIADCPPWFNEGLASLFEHSADEGGRIVGRVNWRLRGLKAGIRNGAVPPFEELLGMDHAAFYRDPAGVHYGTSRYLMYYLQEHGKLDAFNEAFQAGRAKDPTGLAALRSVLGREDLVAFQKEWKAWVMALEG